MPPLTRWFARTSLLYFVAALLAGVALYLAPVAGLPALPLQPTYLHMLVVGWITQLIFGIVYWMFPKYSTERPRGSDRVGWASYWLLNAGLLLRVVGEPLIGAAGQVAGPLLLASAVLQWLAGLAFVLNTWPRVKEK